MLTNNRLVSLSLFLFLTAVASTVSAADYAPVPRRAPRVPVARQQLAEKQSDLPSSRVLEGSVIIIDSEKLKVGTHEFRLFGIVPPQLSASFGPQARSAMDKLTQGTPVQCQIRDRANDGRLLATCQTASGTDIALDLLRHGLAVTARGSLHQSELAGPYAAAEHAAQNQKIGLWSGVLPIPTPAPIKNEIKQEATGPAPVAAPVEKEAPLKIEPISAASLASTPTATEIKKSSLTATADSIIEANPDALSDEDLLPTWQSHSSTFIERYQLLFTGLLMLACALSIITAILFQRKQDRHEEKRAIAAALRGELMAARAVCLAKIQSMTDEIDSKNNTTWPRIRVLVFQAYVGRIGNLGAELARQISSIYGLASDYASFFQTSNTADFGGGQPADRKQALQKLVSHIETVLPKLTTIENQKLFSPAPSSNYQSLTPPTPYEAVPILKTEQVPTLSLASSFTAEKKNEPDLTKNNSDAEIKIDAAEKENIPAKKEANEEVEKKTPEKNEEPILSSVKKDADKETDPKLQSTTQETRKKQPITQTKNTPKAPPLPPSRSEQLKEKATNAWSRFKDLKEQFHSKLIPPVVEITDQEEYMAMLKAEAELFATYDLSDIDPPPSDVKKQKTTA